MKISVTVIAAALFAVMLASVVPAQKPKSKDDSFKEIAALSNTKKPEDAAKAYEMGKDFLSRFGKEKDDKVAKIRDFVNRYRDNAFFISVEDRKYADTFALGRDILAEQPDRSDILLNMAYAGYNALVANKDKSFVDESVGYAKRTAELLDAGSQPKSFVPFKDKDETMAFMYYISGTMMFEKDGKGAADNIYKATTYDSVIKANSEPYYLIASYYEDLYQKLSGTLKVKMDAKTISDADFKTESARIDKAVDLMMDAYARAYKRGEAEKSPNAAQWKQRLSQVYKFRKKTEEGLTEYINYINTTPLPDPSKF